MSVLYRLYDRPSAVYYNMQLYYEKETHETHKELEMWANAQRDGRPAKYRWRPLLNAAKYG